MKRDFDLIRQILIKFEQQETPRTQTYASTLDIEGWSPEEINYNALLLLDAGFIQGQKQSAGQQDIYVIIHRLTWEGHEFLDAARNESVWSKAKELLADSFQTITIEGLKLVLNKLLLDHVSKLIS